MEEQIGKKVWMIPALPALPKRKRVAAYARVSLVTDTMLHSLSAQVSYYSDLIQHHPGWIYAGVYADKNISGALENRPEFQRLMQDCNEGKIDLVLTKSVSRFSRNVTVLLSSIRALSAIGVDVFFEEQNIHSMSESGELMLTLLAAYAQEELYSVSENIKWRKRREMRLGTMVPQKMYGYEVVNRKLKIVPEEARIIRRIAKLYLSGLGYKKIADILTRDGISTACGYDYWNSGTVGGILQNVKLRGSILFQNTYVTDPITGHQVRNRGELPMYLIEGTHEGILSEAEFQAITEERRRRIRYGSVNSYAGVAFRKKIICGCCGQRFVHTRAGRGKNVHPVWMCNGRDKRSKTGGNCTAKEIPEDLLIQATCDALGMKPFDETKFLEQVETILVPRHHELVFVLYDGDRISCTWQNKGQGMKEQGLPDQKTLPDLPMAESAPLRFSKMTEVDIAKIELWRSLGYEFKRIAHALRRPVNTIRTYYLYNPERRKIREDE